jgi:hypothetical protein
MRGVGRHESPAFAHLSFPTSLGTRFGEALRLASWFFGVVADGYDRPEGPAHSAQGEAFSLGLGGASPIPAITVEGVWHCSRCSAAMVFTGVGVWVTIILSVSLKL